MTNKYEHPDITRTLRTGYPRKPDFSWGCPRCSCELGDVMYNIDGNWVCGECFRDWVIEYLNDSPESVARAFSVDTERVRC